MSAIELPGNARTIAARTPFERIRDAFAGIMGRIGPSKSRSPEERERERLAGIAPVEGLRLILTHHGARTTVHTAGEIVRTALKGLLAGEYRTNLSSFGSYWAHSCEPTRRSGPERANIMLSHDVHTIAGRKHDDIIETLVSIMSAPMMSECEVRRETAALCDLAVLETPRFTTSRDRKTNAVVVTAPTPWGPAWSGRMHFSERMESRLEGSDPLEFHLEDQVRPLPPRLVVRVESRKGEMDLIRFSTFEGSNPIHDLGKVPDRIFDAMETLRALRDIQGVFAIDETEAYASGCA